MKNELNPKLEVRFRRSKQRLEPQKANTASATKVFDNLDYQDVDDNAFHEPAFELSFIDFLGHAWFSPVLVQTGENDRQRWHIVVVDGASIPSAPVIYSLGCDAHNVCST